MWTRSFQICELIANNFSSLEGLLFAHFLGIPWAICYGCFSFTCVLSPHLECQYFKKDWYTSKNPLTISRILVYSLFIISFQLFFPMTSEILCLHTFIPSILIKIPHSIFEVFSYILGGSAFSSPGVSEVDNSYETEEKLMGKIKNFK